MGMISIQIRPCSERMPPSREYVLAWHHDSLSWHIAAWLEDEGVWRSKGFSDWNLYKSHMTHWMPLPETPEG